MNARLILEEGDAGIPLALIASFSIAFIFVVMLSAFMSVAAPGLKLDGVVMMAITLLLATGIFCFVQAFMNSSEKSGET